MNDNWRLGGMVLWIQTWIALVPPVSIEDRLLLWMVVRSQTYYPEHILAYGSGKAHCALVVGSGFFRTD